jgi:hypothetical protein
VLLSIYPRLVAHGGEVQKEDVVLHGVGLFNEQNL